MFVVSPDTVGVQSISYRPQHSALGPDRPSPLPPPPTDPVGGFSTLPRIILANGTKPQRNPDGR